MGNKDHPGFSDAFPDHFPVVDFAAIEICFPGKNRKRGEKLEGLCPTSRAAPGKPLPQITFSQGMDEWFFKGIIWLQKAV